MSYAHFGNPREHVKFAKSLRKTASLSEQKLWAALSQMQKQTNLKFRRQQPLNPYVVDFACMSIRLAIELDGTSHDARQEYDEQRRQHLAKQGWTILRFSNDDVLQNLEGVVESILVKAQEFQQQKS